eukprot:640371-Pyramimonas_sp.AAC.1
MGNHAPKTNHPKWIRDETLQSKRVVRTGGRDARPLEPCWDFLGGGRPMRMARTQGYPGRRL